MIGDISGFLELAGRSIAGWESRKNPLRGYPIRSFRLYFVLCQASNACLAPVFASAKGTSSNPVRAVSSTT